MHAVDHAHPIHDHLCRCPRCKPAPRHDTLLRLKVALLIAAACIILFVAFR